MGQAREAVRQCRIAMHGDAALLPAERDGRNEDKSEDGDE
jgi:hypothetical protein